MTRNALLQMVRIADPRQRAAAWEALKQGASMRQIRAQRSKSRSEKAGSGDGLVRVASKLLRDIEASPDGARASLASDRGRDVLSRLHAHLDTLLQG